MSILTKFFVQIGAADGLLEWVCDDIGLQEDGDHIYKLVEQGGWQGIFVEPNPHSFNKLKQLYKGHKGMIFENCAIAEEDGEKDFYVCHAFDCLSSFSLEHIRKHDPDGNQKLLESVEKIRVPCMSLHSLLVKHNMQHIDLLQIDTEGYDYRVIQSLDFGFALPNTIRYEHKHLSSEDNAACTTLLQKHGYHVQRDDDLNSIAQLAFTTDWFSRAIPSWEEHLADFKDKPNLHFLEIGSWEGRSACWLLQNILTHPSCTLTCIDPFLPSIQFADIPNYELDGGKVERRFDNNIAAIRATEKVHKIHGKSEDHLHALPSDYFHCVYIDGDHSATSVLLDAVQSWKKLKVGGILIFDDYLWTHPKQSSALDNPKVGIDTFLETYEGRYELLLQDWQVIVRKIF